MDDQMVCIRREDAKRILKVVGAWRNIKTGPSGEMEELSAIIDRVTDSIHGGGTHVAVLVSKWDRVLFAVEGLVPGRARRILQKEAG